MNWPKNVSEERDAPWQIVLGSMDTAFCVFASLSLWMEVNFRTNPNALLSPYLFSFCDDNSIPSGGQKSKETAHNMFNKVFKMEEFIGSDAAADNMLGSHSIWKFAATHARRSGCSKDNKDIRGRWKSKTRVSDVYEDTELPFPDAKVAEKLCIGGACYYLFPEELTSNEVKAGQSMIGMLKTFILSNVVPNIRKRLPDSAALVLGKALLWLIYSPYDATHNLVPQEMKNRIQMEWNEIVLAGDSAVDCNLSEYNPIRRVPVVVTGDQGCVYIDVVPSFDDSDGGMSGGRAATGSTGGIQAQLLAIQSLMSQMQRELQEMRTNQMADRVIAGKNFLIVNSNIRRIALQPGLRGSTGTVAGTVAGGNDDNPRGERTLAIAGLGMAPASLSPNPKNLFALWQEYQIGIGGRKAAKLFTQSERGGKMKHKYSRRKVIWTTVRGMVRLGLTADAAIDQIYAVYGQQTCVTKIINLMKKDKEKGTLNPNFRV